MAKSKKPDAISTIVSAALAEGLSYGKYMAKYGYRPPCIYGAQEKPPEKKPEPKPVPTDYEADVTDKVCVICGGNFPPGRSRQSKTCCKECGEKLTRRTKRQIGDRKCAYCGMEIPYAAQLSAKYCCKKCQKAAYRQAARERAAAERAETKKEEIKVNATGQGVNASTWAAMQLLDPHRG